MKTVRTFVFPLLTAAFVTVGTLSFTACSQQAPFDPVGNTGSATLAKKGGQNQGSFFEDFLYDLQNPTYPQSGSATLKYDKKSKAYGSGWIYLDNGSMFYVPAGSFTPPAGTRKGAAVTITMTVEKDEVNDELIYSFSPHGSSFSPEADLTLFYGDLNSGTATLYYIDDQGNYVEAQTDRVDDLKMLVFLKIGHFSRYAFAWSR